MPGPLFRATAGNEVLYRNELPSCCRRAEYGSLGNSFDCPTCGASWKVAEKSNHIHLACGCLVGEEGAVVLCQKGDELARRNSALLPPLYDHDEAAWAAYNAALEEYRAHVRTS